MENMAASVQTRSPAEEMMQDTMDIYKMTVMDRIQKLPAEEKKVLQDLANTPAAQVLGKVLGPELAGSSDALFVDEQPQVEEQPMERPMQRAGLGAR